MKILTFTLLTIFITQSACQEENKEKLVADYKIRYIASLNEFEAEAKYLTYKEGEKKVNAFEPKEGVAVLGKKMRISNTQGYQSSFKFKEKRAYPSEKIKFRFKDHKEQLIEQSIDFKPIQNIRLESEIIQIDSGFYLIWDGEPLVPTEELLLIFDYGTKIGLRTTIMGRTTSNRFFIRKEQLVDLKPGKAKILLTQKIYTPYPEGSVVSGSYNVEYYHRPLTVQIK